ncbi:MAG: trimeric intracellular cation channel family protein [Sedimentisphaerales bacterium]|nr:trimeric intracellular cation channel family protein [Sedimentisphaerales bacterium]
MLIHLLDIFGTFAFSISGAFRAVKYELDLLGVIVLAVATGIGGGIMRDVILGAQLPAALRDESYFITCLVGAVIVFIAAPKIATRWDCVMTADAIGLSVFAAIGAAKAESCDAGSVAVVLMAALTACGGGVVRDVLVSEIPAILKADFYATAALIGGVVFACTDLFDWPVDVRIACTIAITMCLRILAMQYKISLPRARSLPASPSELTKQRRDGQVNQGK